MDIVAAKIALNRFGLGARPGEAAAMLAPRGWLEEQVATPPAPVPGIGTSRERMLEAVDVIARQARGEHPHPDLVEGFLSDMRARLSHSIASTASFVERLACFWANHLTVAPFDKVHVYRLALPYENEAIRPHVCGRFVDMLKASCRHQAMMIFLELSRDIGPHSQAAIAMAAQGRVGTYNENYARELMELHTVGVDGGYDQGDVIEMALLLSGTSLGMDDGGARWIAEKHEPGERKVMGRTFAAGQEEQSDAVLEMLATHPRTAARLSRKLATHFLGANPPEELVADMTRAWIDGDGNLPAVYRVLIAADAAWTPTPLRAKTPHDLLISAARATGCTDAEVLLTQLRILSHVPYLCPAPTGWPDDDESWLSPSSAVARLNAAAAVAGASGVTGGVAAVSRLFSDVCDVATGTPSLREIERAPSHMSALALMLASPEFQRR